MYDQKKMKMMKRDVKPQVVQRRKTSSDTHRKKQSNAK